MLEGSQLTPGARNALRETTQLRNPNIHLY